MATDSTVSPLRQRMIEDMAARKLGRHSQRRHIHSCKRFAAYLERSPDTATPDDVRRFQLHLIESGLSICNRNRIMTGVRFLLRVTLRRHDLAAEVYHLKEPQKLPLVLSPDETKRLLAMARSIKVRVVLSLGYGCGLRAGQVVRLQVKHIDSAQGIIRIEQAKGRKDLSYAVARGARASAAMVDGAHDALRRGRGPRGALAVPWPQAGPADDDAPAQPPVPRDGGRGRHQEGGDAAFVAPQL